MPAYACLSSQFSVFYKGSSCFYSSDLLCCFCLLTVPCFCVYFFSYYGEFIFLEFSQWQFWGQSEGWPPGEELPVLLPGDWRHSWPQPTQPPGQLEIQLSTWGFLDLRLLWATNFCKVWLVIMNSCGCKGLPSSLRAQTETAIVFVVLRCQFNSHSPKHWGCGSLVWLIRHSLGAGPGRCVYLLLVSVSSSTERPQRKHKSAWPSRRPCGKTNFSPLLTS